MNYEILKDDRLRIYLEEGDREELLETIREWDVPPNASDVVMCEALEPLICNSELEWSSPDSIAALTDAPVLCICEQGVEEMDNDGCVGYVYAGTAVNVGGPRIFPVGHKILQAWAYMDYQARSPQQDLLEYGECFWECGWKVEE